ncbi:MAG: Pyrimidine-specific ribonucleoside hydrolase RihA [Phycisphaerae bacterium]|nr:Pyrimidine-specific ribonucleoside hydrolase RihA [Phycisphaerae bacterium]
MKTKVLLDTDIGNDIDDACALAYLLAEPRCELLGVTTVSAGGLDRARMCSALCEAAGRGGVPIYPGVEPGLIVPSPQQPPPQAEALKRWKHRSDFPQHEAIAFLQRTIRENPGQVVLLAIGPMTNVACLFAADPEIPTLLKSLVLMCGVFTRRLAGSPVCEWNALNDPHATAMVYDPAGVRPRPAVHRSIGLDVTRQVTLAADEVRRRFASAQLLRPVLDFAEVWFAAGPKQITFHDPLAAVTIFDDQVCRFERGCVDVELCGSHYAGATVWKPDPAGPHEAAMAVDAERFFSRYFGVFA